MSFRVLSDRVTVVSRLRRVFSEWWMRMSPNAWWSCNDDSERQAGNLWKVETDKFGNHVPIENRVRYAVTEQKCKAMFDLIGSGVFNNVAWGRGSCYTKRYSLPDPNVDSALATFQTDGSAPMPKY